MSEAASAAPADASVEIASHALGLLRVNPVDVRTFPRGLVGFPECRQFALLAVAGRTGMFWLQSVDYPALAFLLVDPFVVREGYSVDLTDIDRHELAVRDPAELLVLVVVTLSHEAGVPCTANFQGPVAVNLRTGTGKQLVLADAPAGVRTPIDLSRCLS